jgi:hypothetical protein
VIAYICDRCGEHKPGKAEARVFVQSLIVNGQGGKEKALATLEDLCSQCTTELLDFLRPPKPVTS